MGKNEKGKIITNYKQRVRNSNKSLKTRSSEKNSITIVNRTNRWVNPLDELGPSQMAVCRSNVQKMKLPICQKLHQAKRHSIAREIALKKVGS
jgi:hypothetical protein